MDLMEDDIIRMPMWKSYLYHLQQQAPKPKRIVCQRDIANKPPYYGREYHGAISREDADFLLTIGGEGSYLIRESLRAPGQFTLAIRFEGHTKNFKLYYDGQHYVGEKRFDTVQDLVADGLITFYLEAKAADYIAALSSQSNYAESPYVAYNTYKKRQLAAPRRTNRRTQQRSERSSRRDGGAVGGAPSAAGAASAAAAGGGGGGEGRQNVRNSRANIPMDGRLSQMVENRVDAIIGGGPGSSSVTPPPASSPPSTSSSSSSSSSTSAGGSAPAAAGAAAAGATSGDPAANSSYYQNSEIIQQHQQKHHQQQGQGRSHTPSAAPAAPSSSPQQPRPTKPVPAPRESISPGGGAQAPPSGLAPVAPIGQSGPSVSIPANASGANLEEELTVEGRVSCSTNTDGPWERRQPTERERERERGRRQPSAAQRPVSQSVAMASGGATAADTPDGGREHNSRRQPQQLQPEGELLRSNGTSSLPLPHRTPHPAHAQQIRDSKQLHNFKMLEDPHFSTPPSSPPPNMHAGGDFKLSSVSWCTDYLEVMGSEKPHNFKQHTFKGPHWCDYCANFLWGLIAQGVKCQDCGFNAHKKCSDSVPNDCMPDMRYVKRFFGVDLTTLVKAHNTLIPAVVERCVREIEKRGLESEGLYRVAGFHDDVEAIKMQFDKDIELTDISEEKYDDINTIASVLKLYFRLLPIPLITFDVYFKVMDTVMREDISMDVKMEKLKHMLAQLPPAHYHTLKYLVAHLHRATEHQQQNMMSSENLAIVFAPTLLRSPENDPLTSLTAVKYERELVEILIIHQTILFD